MPNTPLNKEELQAHIKKVGSFKYGARNTVMPDECAERIADFILADRDAAVREAEQRGAAFAIMVTDELHFASHSDDDHIFKNIKNMVRGRFEAATGIDPAPTYPVRAKLLSKTSEKDSNA